MPIGLPQLSGSGGFAKSVLSAQTAGRMAKAISKAKIPSDNPTIPKKPIQYRKYNPIKVAIHARGSKKLKTKLGSFPSNNSSGLASVGSSNGSAFGGQ